MQLNNKLKLIFVAAVAACSSCKKDKTTETGPGSATISFANKINGSSLVLGNQWYQNANGDSFTVSKFNYYISNIRLIGANGTADFYETDSYHLIEHTNDGSGMSFNMTSIPTGTYSAINFMIGVDSLHNVSGAQGGALDPALGNFWSWSSGYIMLKFEGNAPKAPTTGGQLVFHCGGFSGSNSVLKTVTLSLPTTIQVSSASARKISLTADVLQLFRSPNVISFASTTTIHMPGAAAKALSDNYAGMFSVTAAQ